MTAPDADITVRGWGPVTIRVAWTLVAQGVTVRPEVLRDARDHVWFHLAPDTSVVAAEDRAEWLTQAFVARARGRVPVEPFVDDREMALPQLWRDRLHRGLSTNARWVLRMHLADRHPLDAVAARMGEDVLALEAAREGLREVVRRTAKKDGVDLDGWADDRLDHLLHRLVVLPPASEPPLLEIVDGLHPEHIARCVRSTRALHLVRMGVLKRADLVPPHGIARPNERVRVLALSLHPDARAQRRQLMRELGARSFPVGDDLLLVDSTDVDAVVDVLRLAAEVGAPSRDHLRGALVEGPGRWSKHGVIGPLVAEVAAPVRSIPWGTIDDVCELPGKLPEPPSPRWAWTGVAAAALVTAAVLHTAFRPLPPPVDHPLAVTAVPARQGIWLDFDVDEDAYVFVVREQAGQLDVVLDSHRIADKIAHATGDGRYRLHAVGDGLLVASASHPIPRLAELVAKADASPAPLEELAGTIREGDPKVDVKLAR